MAHNIEIPYGAYWSTPFARWQGAYSGLNSLQFAARVVASELAARGIPGEGIDHGVLGISVPQKHAFYGLPWLAGMAGLGHLAGPTMMQACATGARVLLAAAQEVEAGLAQVSLAVTCDRTSNGPHIYYPNPRGPGGTGGHEDWVMDNFGCDPLGPHSMLETAEKVAAKHGITTAEQHDVVLRREAQYRDALADDAAFLKRFMRLPFEVPDPSFRKTATTLAGDYTRPAFAHFSGKAVLFWSGVDNVTPGARNLYVTSALDSTDPPVPTKQSGCAMVAPGEPGERGRIPGAAALLLPAALLAMRKYARKAFAR